MIKAAFRNEMAVYFYNLCILCNAASCSFVHGLCGVHFNYVRFLQDKMLQQQLCD